MNNTVEISGNDIVINGEPVQIRSGAMHYFRIHPDYWRDRIVKLKQCGLNTLETYMAWNFHESIEGELDFSGWKDIVRFIGIAQEEGLMVIVRPGPYICSEWDMGGLPAWLLTKSRMHLRCMNPVFIEAADRYMKHVLELLYPLQVSNGGPVIAVQLENEYGAYGDDIEYMRHLKQLCLDAQMDVILFTSDGPSERNFQVALPEVLATCNFRNHPAENLKILDTFRPGEPKFCMELWCGGAHHWGKVYPEHPVEGDNGVRNDIREAMENNLHFNIYMFHGGSNFGFMNGANFWDNTYTAMLSTYDVDSPLSEEGDPTPKYFAVNEEIRKQLPELPPARPEIIEKYAYGEIGLNEVVTLNDALLTLTSPVFSVAPESMEYYGQSHGFIMYRKKLTYSGMHTIGLDGLRDRAIIMLDGKIISVIFRNDIYQKFQIAVPESGAVLDILVENMGRINFGSVMELERKGISGITFGGAQLLFNWEVYPLPLNNIDKLCFTPATAPVSVPAFYRGVIDVEDTHDTFIKIPDGTKGVVFINGFNLGRYWQIGPQKTLYIPAPLLKKGRNEVVVFELQNLGSLKAEFVDKRDFGTPAPMPFL